MKPTKQSNSKQKEEDFYGETIGREEEIARMRRENTDMNNYLNAKHRKSKNLEGYRELKYKIRGIVLDNHGDPVATADQILNLITEAREEERTKVIMAFVDTVNKLEGMVEAKEREK